MKNDYELVKGQLVVSRDSIYILSNVVGKQDSLISTQDSIIVLHKDNEARYLEMLDNKDKIVGLKDKQIKQAKTKALTGWALAVVNGVLLVIKLI